MTSDSAEKVYAALNACAAAVAVALDERDVLTHQHCNRVRGLSWELGRACGLSERELLALVIAAGFHDIGKIGIPDAVLKKRGPLDERDWAIMKAHSTKGERIIRAARLDDGDRVALAVRHHHERFDGNGYPDGLAGDAIPILARIVAIVDAYDAMSSTRTYGPARGHAAIMEELRREQGRQHDPHLIDKFAHVIEASRFRALDRSMSA